MSVYRKHDSKASSENIRNLIFKDVDLKNKKILNVGCGNDYVDGWINVDGDKRVKADRYWDLESKTIYPEYDCDGPFDIIYASHILEHIHNLVELKEILTCMLKPNGILIVIVPDYLSPDAWGDDTHCRAFSKESFLLCFWPKFVNGDIKMLKIQKDMGECQWIVAHLHKGE